MEQFIMKGGNPLVGEVTISGAKNAALGILAASILTDEDVLIENLPDVRDINVFLEAVSEIGAMVDRIDRHTVRINAKGIHAIHVDDEYIRRIRASYYFIGALLGKYKSAQVPLPGGCNIGSRPIDQHLKGFRALGAKVQVENGAVLAHAIDLAKITGILVPVMGGLYIAAALLMIILHGNMIPGMFASIVEGAFDIQAIFGGFMGSVVMLGIKRGLFSNEAGVGASATAAGSAGVSHPVKQGLVQVLSVFIDTIVICSATAFLLLCSGVAPSADMAGMAYVQAAMNNVFGTAGVVFITVALILFAFTTLLGNYYFAETGMAYLCGKTPVKGIRITQRVIAIVIVLIGSVASLGIVWDTADVLMGLMAVINVPIIFLIAKPALRCLEDYRAQKQAGKNPVFKAADIELKEETDFWN